MSKKRGSILKKTGVALFIGLWVTTASFLSFVSAAAIKSDVSTKKKYNQPAIVQDLLNEFEVSSDYLRMSKYGYYTRLEYNKNDPIYVSFSKSFDQYPEVKKSAQEALEYVFGIINRINPDYYYKIVSETERGAQSAFGKSTIKFVDEEISSTDGYIIGLHKNPFNYYDITKYDANYSSNKISVDLEKYVKTNDYQPYMYTFAHELMHCFGFDDIYQNYVSDGVHYTDSLRRLRGDTFMDTFYGPQSMLVTPKDFAKLCAVYMPKLDGADYEAYKQKLNKLIEDYTKEYYQQFEKVCCEKFAKNKKIDVENIKRPENLEYMKAHIFDMSNFSSIKTYVIEINILDEDKYQINVIDDYNKHIISSCSGDIIKTDKLIILKDCYFPEGIVPNGQTNGYNGGYIQDWCLLSDGEKSSVFSLTEANTIVTKEVKYKETNQETDDSIIL